MPVAFDTTGMERHDERTWFDPRTGDQVSLTYIGLVPDLPTSLDDVPLLRNRLTMETAEVGALIEAHVVLLDQVPALYQLIKLPIPNQQTGLAFIAAFTLPKATCSAVLRIQCAEGQPTGFRESMVVGQVGVENAFPPHPYAPEVRGLLPFNVADDALWDRSFPDHPLTRARLWAHRMVQTARVDPGFAQLPPFRAGTAQAPPAQSTPAQSTPAPQPLTGQPPDTAPPLAQPPGTHPPGVPLPAGEPPASHVSAVQPPDAQPPAGQPPTSQPPSAQPPGVYLPTGEPSANHLPAAQPPGGQPPASPPPGFHQPAGEPPASHLAAAQPSASQPPGGPPDSGPPPGFHLPAGESPANHLPAAQPPASPPSGASPDGGSPPGYHLPAGQPPASHLPAGQPPASHLAAVQTPGSQLPSAQLPAGQPPATQPSAQQPPAEVGDVLHTVLVGLPLGDYLPLWQDTTMTFWRMTDPAAVRERLGIGMESRSEIDNKRYREAAMFSPERHLLFLMDRYRDESGNLGGTNTQLIPATADEAYRAVDDKALSELYAWLGEVVLLAAKRGEFVAVETGGWQVPLAPVVLIMLRTDGREWHSVVETSPVPHGAPVWRDQQPVNGDTQVLTSPATDATLRASGLLTRFAVATWSLHPFHLGLSFGPNPTLG